MDLATVWIDHGGHLAGQVIAIGHVLVGQAVDGDPPEDETSLMVVGDARYDLGRGVPPGRRGLDQGAPGNRAKLRTY